MGLRWEAHTIFLGRVIDATETALTKHDPILLPASTRLGRVRHLSANVMVCVACDRPMCRKGKTCRQDGDNMKENVGMQKETKGQGQKRQLPKIEKMEVRPHTTYIHI